MRIEKNICESILATLFKVKGKTKDTFKARKDMEDMKTRKELHLIKRPNGKYARPSTSYTLKKKNASSFCECLKSVKFPDGFASNINICVNEKEGKILGLKSHA